MSRGDESIVASILLGLLGLVFLASIFGKKICPVCKKSVSLSFGSCPYCGSDLR